MKSACTSIKNTRINKSFSVGNGPINAGQVYTVIEVVLLLLKFPAQWLWLIQDPCPIFINSKNALKTE